MNKVEKDRRWSKLEAKPQWNVLQRHFKIMKT